jgi:putative peptidoglycan lipid II flippase
VGVVLLGFLGVALLVVLAGPLMIGALGLGIDDPAIAAEQRRVGVLLLALVMPQLLLYGVAGAGGSAMNSQGRFAIAAAAPVVENVGIIAALLAAGFIWGRGLELGAVTNEHIVFVGLGSTAAVVLHAAVQCWGAHRVGLSLRPRWGWREPVIRGILRAARPSLGFSVMNAARMFTTLVAANAVAGGAVAYNLALAFYFLVAALIARPVSTALLPVLVRLRESGDMQGVRDRLDGGYSWIVFLGLPAALGMAALSVPLAHAVTFGDLSEPRSVAMVAACLAGLSIGALAEAVFILSTTASYAVGEPGAPFRQLCCASSSPPLAQRQPHRWQEARRPCCSR